MSDRQTAADYRESTKRHPVDEVELPRWAEGPDGRYVDISDDDRFADLFALWQDDACEHPKTGIVRWTNAGSQTCFNWFCAHCGAKLSPNIPHALAKEHGVVNAALDDLASRSRVYVATREQRLTDIRNAAAQRVQPGAREEYDDYLRSDRWRTLRGKILKRAAGVCEGCLDAPAEHVHHMTYDHKGAEFAFELRALCAGCHKRIHGEVE